MKLIITGATGMVGSEVLREAITDNEIESITIIVRRPADITHPKLKTILPQNFLDYSSLENEFKNNDALIWCLGISQNVVSRDEYIKITYDYTIAAAKAIVQNNDELKFLFISGEGADNTEQTKILFAKIKGRTENALMQMPLKRLSVIRPGAIIPVHKQNNLPFILKLQYGLVKAFKWVKPSMVITSAELAKVLLYIAKEKPPGLFRQINLKSISKQW
jgi:nucleoside-diphosphate-sugar epimerase